MYVIVESLYCSTEMNLALYANYTGSKNFLKEIKIKTSSLKTIFFLYLCVTFANDEKCFLSRIV